jgi:hypothetical protein
VTGRRIAVIGGGISGLTAGYVLSRTDRVTLFEADGRLGGHADTHLVGPVPVDTGFIVYNERTYPLLTRLFAELGVSTRAAEMSMSVRCAGCGLNYAGKRGPGGLAAGLRRGGGRFLRLLADVPRFHRAARELLNSDTRGDPIFGQFLDRGGYSGYFQAHFALPLVAAVWSCPAGTAQEYPVRYLFAFLANHGMLSMSGSPPWRTVAGGSRCYVERAARRLACVRLGVPVRASTTIAAALGQNTGTTSYHLRMLADAGVIEEIPERAHGRERWWRVIPVDHREPDYETLSPEDRAALDEWRAQQIPGELVLVNRYVRDFRKHGKWAKASRAAGWYTVADLEALMDEYIALLHKYGHSGQDAPPGARPMQLRMFYIPDEPDEQH